MYSWQHSVHLNLIICANHALGLTLIKSCKTLVDATWHCLGLKTKRRVLKHEVMDGSLREILFFFACILYHIDELLKDIQMLASPTTEQRKSVTVLSSFGN